MICEKVITQHIRKVRSASDRAMAGVFAADILTKGQINQSLWGNLLEEVVALFELPIEGKFQFILSLKLTVQI